MGGRSSSGVKPKKLKGDENYLDWNKGYTGKNYKKVYNEVRHYILNEDKIDPDSYEITVARTGSAYIQLYPIKEDQMSQTLRIANHPPEKVINSQPLRDIKGRVIPDDMQVKNTKQAISFIKKYYGID